MPSRCWSNHSPGETFPGVLSGFQHRLSGTRFHKQFWSATLSVFKYRLKKLFIHISFHWTLIRADASASEVTTVYVYILYILQYIVFICINSIIIIIIIMSNDDVLIGWLNMQLGMEFISYLDGCSVSNKITSSNQIGNKVFMGSTTPSTQDSCTLSYCLT